MFLADTFTRPILKALVPLFWISGDISSEFKARIDGFIHWSCDFSADLLFCLTLMINNIRRICKMNTF